jgi:hypothetical protein
MWYGWAFCDSGVLTQAECTQQWAHVAQLADATPEARRAPLSALEAHTATVRNEKARVQLRQRLTALRSLR